MSTGGNGLYSRFRGALGGFCRRPFIFMPLVLPVASTATTELLWAVTTAVFPVVTVQRAPTGSHLDPPVITQVSEP